MALDWLTISAAGIVILMLAIVIFLLRRQGRELERGLRCAIRQQDLIQRHAGARRMCETIRSQHPEACPGLDFELEPDGDHARIIRWKLPGTPPPD